MKHFNGVTFVNPEIEMHKGFRDFLRWQLWERGKRQSWPIWRENEVKSAPLPGVEPGHLSTTFINHATHLVRFNDAVLMTDPVYSERVSPVQWAGPKRVRSPGLEFEHLPKIDFVLVSHNHYDHMDAATIARLQQAHAPQFLTPLQNGHLLKRMGALQVRELDWWQSMRIENLEITLVPAQHWSGRGLRDRNLALWGGFFVRHSSGSFYFAGDTGYGRFFNQIQSRLGAPDLAILPIGAYEPRWFMKLHHMNPEEAVQAHLDLQARQSVATHFGTFQLTDEGMDQPVEDLQLALKSKKISNASFRVLRQGETWTWTPGST